MPYPTVVIVPGWHNSGPRHWQSLWHQSLPRSVRVEQDDWRHPLRKPWVERLIQTIEQTEGPILIAAHSLGCITTAHLPASAQTRIHGALLVAPADPENRSALADFAPVPRKRLQFPSIVVGSSNDPFSRSRKPSNMPRPGAAAWCCWTNPATSMWNQGTGTGLLASHC